MSGSLPVATPMHGLALPVEHHPLPADQVRAGEPTSGSAVLGILGSGILGDGGVLGEGGERGVEIGVWEMTPGVATDVEVDEMFIVLTGRARVEFEGDMAPIEIGPGDVVRLTAGLRTAWTVTETLRKVYLAV